jgi:hypothetical protein
MWLWKLRVAETEISSFSWNFCYNFSICIKEGFAQNHDNFYQFY